MQGIVTRIASVPFMDIGVYYFIAEAVCIIAFLYRRMIFYVYWYFIFGIFLPITTLILYSYFYLGFTALNHSWSHIALLQFLTIISSGSISWVIYRNYPPYEVDNPSKAILLALIAVGVSNVLDYYSNGVNYSACTSLKCEYLAYLFGDGSHVSFITYGAMFWTSSSTAAMTAMAYTSLKKGAGGQTKSSNSERT